MDVAFTHEQDLLRTSARDFLDDRCPIGLVREAADAGAGGDGVDRLWDSMAQLGWMGLGVDEGHGGLGRPLVDLAILSEEMGRSLVPAPWFSTVGLFTEAIRVAGDARQRGAWLPRIAAGEVRGTLAILERDGVLGRDGVTTTATPAGDGYRLEGSKAFVPDLDIAGSVVVAALLEGQPGLFVVDAGACELTDEAGIDPTRRLATLRLPGAEVGSDCLLGGEPCGWATIERVLDRATALQCAEMCGGAQKVLELTVEYARTRQQFGRPIGSFQGVSHRCAEMLLAVESARSLSYYAAWCCDEDLDNAPLAVSAAKAWTGDTYRAATSQAIQLHGGIGFTWEANLHLWYRRALAMAALLGDPGYHRERVATLIDL
ncbi:MAG: acyl-CoA dehydrogenase [Chloroflexi bacterium]|nr:MAG: acyl-CoA dehydrogenase [Chloroflexota bacterium]